MNVCFLSPHFPPNWFRFVMGLHNAGATTLGISDQPWETLRPELRANLDEFYQVTDLGDHEQLTRALGWLIHRRGMIDRIDSLNEHWLEMEARLRTDFNIPGLDNRTIAAVKRKSVMKKRFVAAGIPVARGRVCRTPRSLRQWIAEIGYPVVAKPDVGVGAVKTYKLENDADVERYVHEKPAVDYIVEEFVEGQIVTYDGLAGRLGEIVFDSSFTYSHGVMESVNEQVDLYYWISREIPEDVRAVGMAMARAFDVRERPFHFEMFRLDDGRLVALEVNMRPAGGLSVDMINFANDFDFYQQWANVVVRGEFDAVVSRPFACLYVMRRDGRPYALSHEDLMREFGDLVILEARMDRTFAPAMGDHAYVLRGSDERPLLAAAQEIQALR